jgi:hypothetical protein
LQQDSGHAETPEKEAIGNHSLPLDCIS